MLLLRTLEFYEVPKGSFFSEVPEDHLRNIYISSLCMYVGGVHCACSRIKKNYEGEGLDSLLSQESFV